MTLREEYEKEVDRLSDENSDKPSILSSLFKKSNKHYIEWLEAKLKKLSVADVSGQLPIEKCNSCGSKKVELIHRCKCGVEW